MEQNKENTRNTGEKPEEAVEHESSGTRRVRRSRKRLLYEQRYEEERSSLMLELQQLRQGKHSKYLQTVARLQDELNDRMLWIEIERNNELAAIEREFVNEIAAAELEFEEKKAEFIQHTIADLENEKRMLQLEFLKMDVNKCPSGKQIPAIERTPGKRRKRMHGVASCQQKQPNFSLKEEEIACDLEKIFADAAAVQNDTPGNEK